MARNIEIKARAGNFQRQMIAAQQLANSEPLILRQIDTFYSIDRGRLKLREFADQVAQLIHYVRPDEQGPALSEYRISEVNDVRRMKSLLEAALGVRQVVSKTRRLFLVGQTRIHFDDVDALGHFIELEVVLTAQQSLDSGQKTAEHLMSELGINDDDLVNVAYVDLLERAA